MEDIVQTIKSDLVPDDVFVFTPRGDVINLPTGATVIDFAYAIHSAVGNRMVGAKVDGRIVPLDYQVKTGEIVEVLTSAQPGKGPSRDWLKIVRTSEARGKIRAWYKKEKREENIIEGKAELGGNSGATISALRMMRSKSSCKKSRTGSTATPWKISTLLSATAASPSSA